MKLLSYLTLVALAWIALVPAAWADGGIIRVQVSGFRNADGDLGCAMFSDPKTFPGGEAIARVKVAAAKDGAECLFTGVQPGHYAISVLHDENRNGKMDRVPLIGMPREGYGVSNNKTYSTHAPLFDESAFDFDGHSELVLSVTLRY
jgi:uncharacterized protein (DUF2141 family)